MTESDKPDDERFHKTVERYSGAFDRYWARAKGLWVDIYGSWARHFEEGEHKGWERFSWTYIGLLSGMAVWVLLVGLPFAGIPYINALGDKFIDDAWWVVLVIAAIPAAGVARANPKGSSMAHMVRGAVFPYWAAILFIAVAILVNIGWVILQALKGVASWVLNGLSS